MSAAQSRNYVTYCIVDESRKLVYVDRSFAKNLQPILRRFVQGTDPLTVKVFGLGPHPHLFLVEHLRRFCPASEADAYVKAWQLRFAELGYQASCRPDLVPPSGKLTPNVILPLLRRLPPGAELHGERHICRKAGTDARSAAQKYAASAAQSSVSFHLSSDVADAFRFFCDTLGVTKNQGLGLLLERAGESGQDLATAELLQRLARADGECNKLRKELEDLRGKRLRRRQKRSTAEERAQAIRREIDRMYVDLTHGTRSPYAAELKPMRLPYLHRLGPSLWKDYIFPDGIGAMMFRLQHKIYGRNVGVNFLLGEGSGGIQVKFRCTPAATSLLGRSMWGDDSCEGDMWIVGYAQSDDGATDVVTAIPVPSPENASISNAPAHSTERKPSLDTIIGDSTRRTTAPKYYDVF